MPEAKPQKKPKKKRLLLVDDDPQMIDLLEFFAAANGYDFVSHMNGKKAAAAALEGGFDLIIMDVMLRNLSGYKVAQEIGERLGENCPPILIITSRDTQKDRGLVLMSGATSVLQKPFKPGELERVVEILLEKKKP